MHCSREDKSKSFLAWAAAIALLLLIPSRHFAGESPTPESQLRSSRLDFPTTILPIFTKAGCNTGACHGAAIGQGGLRLSLLGYDPDQDYDTLTRELAGRRISIQNPSESLLLRKPTRELRHKGGLRIKKDSEDYKTLLAWLSTGAPYGHGDLRVTALQVSPPDVLATHPGQSLKLRVTATLSNGESEDVTSHALFGSNDDDAVAEVSDAGEVTLRQSGLTAITVRYSGQVAAVQVAVPYQGRAEEFTQFIPVNFIDRHVLAQLQRLHIPPSPLCEDSEFLRRISLDLAGRLPTPDEARAFLKTEQNTNANEDASARFVHRQKIIDDWLRSEEFVDFWTLKLADLLLINSKRLGDAPAKAYHAWLRQQVSGNSSWNKLAADLLTAQGSFVGNAPANFHRLTRDPRDMGEFVSRTMLGVQIACARCHTHPFAGWTQDDYHRFAAYFARTDSDGEKVFLKNQGEVQHPKSGKDVRPKPLGSPEMPDEPMADRRAPLVQWLTSSENPWFARAFVNRVWKQMMGRGLIEPADDVRVTNPPTNPELLASLETYFQQNGYDLRKLIRVIASSRVYQLSSHANAINRADDRFFSRALTKPLTAQVLADAIVQVTEVPDHYEGFAEGTRAVQLTDAQTPSHTLDVFGRCSRESSCENTSRFGGGLSQTLYLINSSSVHEKLKRGRVNRLLLQTGSPKEMVEELYLSALSRFPNSREQTYCEELISKAENKQAVLEDLLWALLNSREFAYNR